MACSGGPDSVGLVWALAGIKKELGCTFYLAHVNHQLRGTQSKLDEKFVFSLSKDVHWPLLRKTLVGIQKKRGNLEEQARVERYKALEGMARKVGCQVILTGHTLDDQVETVFLHLLRGTGPDGMSGMNPMRLLDSGVYLGRPLLKVDKKTILKFLKQIKQSFRVDDSNQNLSFSRNWLRKKMMPQLEKRFPGTARHMGMLAQLVRDEQQVWNDIIEQFLTRCSRPFQRGTLLDLKGLNSYPPSIQRRLLRRIVGEESLTFERLEGWRLWMMAPPTQSRIWQLKNGWIAERLSKSKGAPSAHLCWVHLEE